MQAVLVHQRPSQRVWTSLHGRVGQAANPARLATGRHLPLLRASSTGASHLVIQAFRFSIHAMEGKGEHFNRAGSPWAEVSSPSTGQQSAGRHIRRCNRISRPVNSVKQNRLGRVHHRRCHRRVDAGRTCTPARDCRKDLYRRRRGTDRWVGPQLLFDTAAGGWWFTLVAAVFGSIILIWLLRLFTRV